MEREKLSSTELVRGAFKRVLGKECLDFIEAHNQVKFLYRETKQEMILSFVRNQRKVAIVAETPRQLDPDFTPAYVQVLFISDMPFLKRVTLEIKNIFSSKEHIHPYFFGDGSGIASRDSRAFEAFA